VKKGYVVTALYRKSIPELEHSNLSWIKGDITDVDALKLLIEKAAVIIYSASLILIWKFND
jgi:hypothetical protein